MGAPESEYRGSIPTTPILTLRFPDGDVEHRSTRGELPVGSLVRSRGAEWRIKAYHGSAAVLEAVETDGGGGGGPATKPAPLDDRPLTLEFLADA